MKKALFILFILCVLAGCTTTKPVQKYDNPDAHWINSNLAGNIAPTKPSLKDDFYQAMNWEWMAEHAVIPPDQFGFSRVSDTCEGPYDQIADMLKMNGSISYEEQLCKKLYYQLSDKKTRDSYGCTGANVIVQKILSVSSFDEFWQLAYTPDIPDCLPFEYTWTSVDRLNSFIFVPTIQFKLLFGDHDNPDTDEYRTATENLKRFYVTMLEKCGFAEDDAEKRVEDAFLFEKDYAVTEKDTSNTYSNLRFQSRFPNIPLFEIMEKKGGDFHSVTLTSEETWVNLNKRCVPENLETLKTLAILRFLRQYSLFLDSEVRDTAFLLSNGLLGMDVTFPDDVINLAVMVLFFREPLEQAWLVRYVPDKSIEEVTEIVRMVEDEYEQRLQSVDWISELTRSKALDKLANLNVFVGHAVMNDWSDFQLYDASVEGALLKNAIKISKQSEAFLIEQANRPNTKDRWNGLSLTDVNAFYDCTKNAISICAGALNGYLYNSDWPVEKKLAGIGYFIGHELTHVFDINGAGYDKDGNGIVWWSNADLEVLVEKSEKIASYAAANDVVDARNDNLLYQGEVTSDAGSLAVLLDIAKRYPSFDYDLFFRSLAEFWGAVFNEYYTDLLIKTDYHPMTCVRINCTLQLYDEFYETYGIEEGDGMYRAPEERFKVW